MGGGLRGGRLRAGRAGPPEAEPPGKKAKDLCLRSKRRLGFTSGGEMPLRR